MPAPFFPPDNAPTLLSMSEALRWLLILIVAVFRERRDLPLENLALRQQVGVLKRVF